MRLSINNKGINAETVTEGFTVTFNNGKKIYFRQEDDNNLFVQTDIGEDIHILPYTSNAITIKIGE